MPLEKLTTGRLSVNMQTFYLFAEEQVVAQAQMQVVEGVLWLWVVLERVSSLSRHL